MASRNAHNEGMSDTSQRHHAIDYVEFTVSDLEQGKRFYGEAFGWQFNDYGGSELGVWAEA